MSIARHHAEWLSLVEVSGPFLSMPVLMRVFPQGLEAHDPERFHLLRIAHEEWEEKQGTGRFNPAIHAAWIKFVLSDILQLPPEVIADGQAIPQTLHASIPEQGEVLRPDLVITNPNGGPGAGKPRLLIQTYPYHQDLDKPVVSRTWKASPGTRMMELLHATGTRLGLVTNGERWMLVDAPKNETTGFASWYATLWQEEPITFRAFISLLGVERFFNVPDNDTLEALLAESASNQQEVTDQLGYQVRRAVEVLIQSLDRADQTHGRALLTEVSETELYEAALTVMMRLVFLFCAEERGLLLLEDELYNRHYAVSTVREQLREVADQHGEELLERNCDAWCRLLATFRTVYGGVRHDRLTLPAYGGRLFDPDRFPFLEGRKRGTRWTETPADPLPVNNRTVLHLLEALQILQIKVPGGGPAEARRLSFRALDIEQIGHVYEGLLDHTAKRAPEPILGLAGTRDREPETPLSKLEEMQGKGEEAFIEYLQEETGRSAKALQKALTGELALEQAQKLEASCCADKKLWQGIQPFAGLVRDDTFGYPMVIHSGSVYVTAGTDRRSSGTHYTPRSLTEPVVQYTLEPLVFVGPAEGKPREQWQLRPASELLDLKICDMACGSGAFLVQACRYMSERLAEAWEQAEKAHPGVPGITPEGKPVTGRAGELLIPKDTNERLTYARRTIAQRCLYGVDKNPLAAEMAKLSLWLLTLAKDKPFTFLDHTIRCGDSLVGLLAKQIAAFHWDEKHEPEFEATFIQERVRRATEYRRKILTSPEHVAPADKEQMLAVADETLEFVRFIGDLAIFAYFAADNDKMRGDRRDDLLAQLRLYREKGDPRLREPLTSAVAALRHRSPALPPFHWEVEFPEVFGRDRPGFDAFVGNPPFMGGKKITGALGSAVRDYLIDQVAKGVRGNADLCCYFFLRAAPLLSPEGTFGLLATNTIGQGETREVALDRLVDQDLTVIRAVQSRPWPGEASLEVSHVWMRRGAWRGTTVLDDQPVDGISTSLVALRQTFEKPLSLKANEGKAFQGSNLRGIGFVLSPEETEALISRDKRNKAVLFPYLNGEDLNSRPDQSPSRWVINFFDWEQEQAEKYAEVFSIVRARVLPERMKIKHEGTRKKGTAFFWRYDSQGKDLYRAISRMRRVLVTAEVSKYVNFAFRPTGEVFSHMLIVFAFDTAAYFALLQSTVHEVFARETGSTLETRFRYTPSECYAKFPCPGHVQTLDPAGTAYDNHRSNIMNSRAEGLTRVYNRFHDPDEAAKDIQKLRDLHVEMDKAVAAAYGWDDLDLGHGFHETKQGMRFTISEPARREVLARLLKLNHERYAEEVAQGLHDKKGRGASGAGRGKKGRKAKPRSAEPTLFGMEGEDAQ